MFTLVICDSRGQGLQEILNEIKDIDTVQIVQYGGAGSVRATMRALPTIKGTPPDLVILMVGICDITQRNKVTKITTLKEFDSETLLNGALVAIRSAVNILRENKCSKISIATVSGVDLADYNNKGRRHMTPVQYEDHLRLSKQVDPHQELMDTTIVRLNKEIVAINRQARCPTTWAANAVHIYFKKAYHHYYKHLQDGCHATTRTKQYWANQVARTVRIMKSRTEESTKQHLA